MPDDAFDQIMESVNPPLVVVTTVAEDERAGCLVGFHAQSSIGPERYSVWLSKANHTYRVALRASHLAVHFLTADDLPMAERFGTQSGEDVDKFAGLDVSSSEYGVPLIDALPNRIVLERAALVDDGGDHVCLMTRVLDAGAAGSFTPLRVSDAAHLDPGHEADERAIEP
ncbi:flavin reductase family protein [Nocardioides sp. SR21]|uniref:flavin reductase family protein n=1 Tax=Nocardioides sp. SR21 TaxID=2919501 RepID=UPI001FAA6179|nr:flavin reductase family protein [Nocardioides sp. SR21]